MGPTNTLYVRRGKRLLDVCFAAMALVIATPLLLVCALAIWLESRGPVFFRQWRAGRKGKPFRIIKLRTMVADADKKGPIITASGDPRITKVGRILRKTKLDEVPQFLNVLCGAMSLVGPRPETPNFVAEYSAEERQVLCVKPGITGRATVCYVDEEHVLAESGNKLEFYVDKVMRDKLRLDLAYARNVSLFEDVSIIFQTFSSVLKIFAPHRRPSFRVNPSSMDCGVVAENHDSNRA